MKYCCRKPPGGWFVLDETIKVSCSLIIGIHIRASGINHQGRIVSECKGTESIGRMVLICGFEEVKVDYRKEQGSGSFVRVKNSGVY